jgi:hypothetical protein
MKQLSILFLALLALQGCKVGVDSTPSSTDLNVTPPKPNPTSDVPPTPPTPSPDKKSACLLNSVLAGKAKAQLFEIQDKAGTTRFNFQHKMKDKVKFDDMFFSTFYVENNNEKKDHAYINFLKNEAPKYKIKYDLIPDEQNQTQISNIEETKFEFEDGKMKKLNAPEYDLSEGLSLELISKNPLLVADDQTISILSDLFLIYQKIRTTTATLCETDNFRIESETHTFTFRDTSDSIFAENDPYPITSPNLIFHEVTYNECPLGINAIDHPTNTFFSTAFFNQIESDDTIFIEPKIRSYFDFEGRMNLEFTLAEPDTFKSSRKIKVLNMEYNSIIISAGKKDYVQQRVIDPKKFNTSIQFNDPKEIPDEFTILFFQGEQFKNPAKSKFYWTKKIKTKPTPAQ